MTTTPAAVRHVESMDRKHLDEGLEEPNIGMGRVALCALVDEDGLVMGRRNRRLMKAVVALDRLEAYKSTPHRDTAEWLSARLGFSSYKARRFVAASYAIEKLPQISEALETCRLDLDRVIQLTRFATPETEKKLIAWARRVTARRVREKAEEHAAKTARNAKRADRVRNLQWWWGEQDSTLSGAFTLPSDQGAAFISAIEAELNKTPESPMDGDDGSDPIHARRADALMALVTGGGGRATVVLHTTREAVGSKQLHSHLDGGKSVNPRLASLLACDARVQEIISDGLDAEALATEYTVPEYLRREVLRRDNYMCTMPGCECRHVDVHHIVAWPDGPTRLFNLVAVCRVHHRLIHIHGWKVRPRGWRSDVVPPGRHSLRPQAGIRPRCP